MNLYGLRRDVDKLKDGVMARQSPYEARLNKTTDELLAAGRAFGLPELDREIAARLIEMVAESDDPCQILIDAGYTSYQAAAKVKEIEARLAELK